MIKVNNLLYLNYQGGVFMKIKLVLSFILLGLFFISCSTSNIEQPVIKSEVVPIKTTTSNKFMSNEAIVNQFQKSLKMTGKTTAPEKFNAEALQRLKTIIKHNLFISAKTLKAIQAKKKALKISAPLTGKGEADLRSKDTFVVSQWDGTCSAHGLTATVENAIGNHVKLSERHVWSKYKYANCATAIKTWGGGNCITTNDAWKHNNIFPSRNYTKPENCYSYLKSNTYIEDDLQKMINALDAGKPVYLGMTVTKSLINCDSAVNPTSAATNGGHALAILGYKLDNSILGGGYFIIKNSWGSSCADHGFQYIPFHYCLRKDMYCVMWTIDEAVASPVLTLLPKCLN